MRPHTDQNHWKLIAKPENEPRLKPLRIASKMTVTVVPSRPWLGQGRMHSRQYEPQLWPGNYPPQMSPGSQRQVWTLKCATAPTRGTGTRSLSFLGVRKEGVLEWSARQCRPDMSRHRPDLSALGAVWTSFCFQPDFL